MIKVLVVTMAFGLLGLGVLAGFVLMLAPGFLEDEPYPGEEEPEQ